MECDWGIGPKGDLNEIFTLVPKEADLCERAEPHLAQKTRVTVSG
jgi:hypothetical protein